MKKYLQLIRVKHWIKNILIFIPMICAGVINYNNVFKTIIGFFSFSFLTSFIYIINDIKDIEKDKLHPRKKKRPLPSGKITKRTAIIIAVCMILVSYIQIFVVTKSIFNYPFIFLLIYMILNIAYSFGLKDKAIIDVVILASGFILRVYYGASIVSVEVSDWLFLTILNASLFLGLGKRRKEFINNKESRKVLEEYNEKFLENFQHLFLALTLVFYSLWTIEQSNNFLVYTIPLLIIIFMKYSLIMEKTDEGDPTTIIYQDKTLLGLCGLYAILMILIMVVL